MISMVNLAFAFLLLGSVLGYICIKTKLNPIIKLFLIIILTWYSIVLYGAPGEIVGWPKMVDELPDRSIVISLRIIEPMGNDPGGIYFWVYEKQDYEPSLILMKINPMLAFMEFNRTTPRAYGIPYDRKVHEQLEDQKSKQSKGSYLVFTKEGSGQDKSVPSQNEPRGPKEKRGMFQILNPVDLLPTKD